MRHHRWITGNIKMRLSAESVRNIIDAREMATKVAVEIPIHL